MPLQQHHHQQQQHIQYGSTGGGGGGGGTSTNFKELNYINKEYVKDRNVSTGKKTSTLTNTKFNQKNVGTGTKREYMAPLAAAENGNGRRYTMNGGGDGAGNAAAAPASANNGNINNK